MDLPGSSARLDEPGTKEVRAAGCRIWDRAGWPLLLPTVGCDDCLGRHSQGLPAATEELGRLELSGPRGGCGSGALLGVVSWDLVLAEGWQPPKTTGAPGAELLAGAAVPSSCAWAGDTRESSE